MKFTIVVPTRERCDTLYHTLRTCVAQDHDPLEILVSDNASQDATREVVESFADPRIRYVNPGRRLSMSRNWEFALHHVGGEYLTFIGDDDGLLPRAVREAAEVIRETRTAALTWMKAEYVWPSFPRAEHANLLSIPLTNELFRYDARRIVRDVCDAWIPYNRAPVVYNSFVRTAVMRECAGEGGEFFRSVTPDVYSGLAIASRIDHYFYSLRPFSVNGASGHSNGSNAIRLLEEGDGDNPVAKFLSENDLPLHPRLPMPFLGSVLAVVVEAILQANDHCFGGRLRIDLRSLVRKMVAEVSRADRRVYDAVVAKLLEITAGSDLHHVVLASKRRYPHRGSPATGSSSGLRDGAWLDLDAARFGVADVFDASRLVDRILGSYQLPAVVHGYRRFDKLRSRIARRLSSFAPDKAL